MSGVEKLLAAAQREAGNKAVECAERDNHLTAREWSELSLTIGYCLRDAVRLLASGELIS